MEPSIPIPTENIYKFAALFGMVMFFSGMLGLIYLTGKYNEMGAANYVELETLRSKENPSKDESVRKIVLERIVQINREDRRKYEWMLTFSTVIGFFISIYGFIEWYKKVQPKQDELLMLQVEKMKREVQVLEKQLEKKDIE